MYGFIHFANLISCDLTTEQTILQTQWFMHHDRKPIPNVDLINTSQT